MREAMTPRRPKRWLHLLLAGASVWLASIAATWWTGVTTLIPTVIITGSFLIPVTFLVWAIQRVDTWQSRTTGEASALSQWVLLRGFLIAGAIGLLASAVIETALLGSVRYLHYPAIAAVEEIIKFAALVPLALGLAFYTRRDGMVLGAAVGFGFAAFESAGYAFDTMVAGRALDMRALVETELVRGLLMPVGHGLWTALVGGALFAASAAARHIRVSVSVIAWLAAATVLHAMWDLAGPLAVAVVYGANGRPVDPAALKAGRLLTGGSGEMQLFQVLNWGILAAVAGVGVGLAVWQWRKGARELADVPSANSRTSR